MVRVGKAAKGKAAKGKAAKGKAAKGKAAKGKSKLKSPTIPHDTKSMIQAAFKDLRFAAIPNIHQTINGLARRIVEGLRPGPGLIGNAEEERKLYEGKDKDDEQMGGACLEENKDEKMGTAESSGGVYCQR